MTTAEDGPNIFFFDVPVYRLGRESYYKQRKEKIDKDIRENFILGEFEKSFYERNPAQLETVRDHLAKSYGGCWEFNEIVGYIKLYFLGSQIRGEYFGVKAKKIMKSRTKNFEWKTFKLAPEISIDANASSKEIFEAVEAYIEDCKRELKGRFCDTRILKTLAPFVDWRALMRSRK